MTNSTIARAVFATAVGGMLASTLVANAAITVRPSAVKPAAATPAANYYQYGGTLAQTQWQTWQAGYYASTSPHVIGCYAPVGTGAAQATVVSSPKPLNPPITGATPAAEPTAGSTVCVYPTAGYPRSDFAAGDAPLTTAQNQTYSTNYSSTRGPVIVVPVAGAALSEAYNTATAPKLPASIKLNNTDLCAIWKGTTTNWDAVTNQATGAKVTSTSLPIKLVARSDGSGSTFIHTNHLNTVCGGYPYVGTQFPMSVGSQSVSNGGLLLEKGSGGIASTVAITSGAIGYVGNNNLVTGEQSALIMNAQNQYIAAANASTVTNTANLTASFTSPTTASPPPGYPVSGGSEIDLYLPNPSATNSYAEVGFTYAFINTCYPTTGGPTAAQVAGLFTSQVYKSGTTTQVGLVPLPSPSPEIALIGSIKAGSSYNAKQGCH